MLWLTCGGEGVCGRGIDTRYTAQALEESRAKRDEVASLRGAKKELDGTNQEAEMRLNVLKA